MEKQINTQVKEIPYSDPINIFEHLAHKKWAIFLDSALEDPHYGRYSYIAVDPFSTLLTKNGRILLNDEVLSQEDNPFKLLKHLIKQRPQLAIPNIPPFQGGAAGSFAYDLYQYLEDIPAHGLDLMDFPDMALGFYDRVISFDHYQKKAWIVSTGWPEIDPKTRALRAKNRLNEVDDLIKDYLKYSIKIERLPKPSIKISSNFTKENYIKAAQEVKDYIFAGDIFQANISQRFECQIPKNLSAFSLYLQLRKRNPAPFAAFFNLGDTQVLSASPERFLFLHEGRVETRPIKGTRARNPDQRLDWQAAEALKNSVKDRAENTMIVDLLRNDLSKVCKAHSVVVTKLCALESYATVHHLVSTIQGELETKFDAVDLLMAAFPGGSVTGAPKIRAMQIIAEIEPSKRGLYCGSIGFLGFNGSMDTSIAIRSGLIKDNRLNFQSGGAIVLDSDPLDEYQESLLKSSAFYNLLNGSHDFID